VAKIVNAKITTDVRVSVFAYFLARLLSYLTRSRP